MGVGVAVIMLIIDADHRDGDWSSILFSLDLIRLGYGYGVGLATFQFIDWLDRSHRTD